MVLRQLYSQRQVDSQQLALVAESVVLGAYMINDNYNCHTFCQIANLSGWR